MQMIPAIPVNVPILLTIDNYMLLAFFVLFPAWIRLQRDPTPRRSIDAVDWCIIAFGALQAIIFVVPDLPGHVVISDSTTNMLRRAFIFVSGNGLIYFLASRLPRSRPFIAELFASFCLSSLILAGIAVFESARSWYLYADFGGRWANDLSYSFYLIRGTSLRAKASASTPLELGYLLAISIGFWLCIYSEMKSNLVRWSAFCLYCLGLLAAYSRGPWIGATAVVFSYIWIRASSIKSVLKIVSGSAVGLVAVSLTPIGTRIAAVIPALGGQVDAGTIDYRQRLLERCWEIFKGSPFFGDQWAYFKMNDLRQGQGIIDFVNTYAQVAVFYGVVGLAFFLAPILIGLIRSYRAAQFLREDDSFLRFGSCIVACIIGSLLMLATTSFFGAYAILFYFLAGIASAYTNQIYRGASTSSPNSNRIARSETLPSRPNC
jgi:hypothetical protein